MDDPPTLQHHRVLGQRERDIRVLLDEDDRRPLVGGHAPDRVRELLDDDRREALERFVEEKQAGIGRERANGDR